MLYKSWALFGDLHGHAAIPLWPLSPSLSHSPSSSLSLGGRTRLLFFGFSLGKLLIKMCGSQSAGWMHLNFMPKGKSGGKCQGKSGEITERERAISRRKRGLYKLQPSESCWKCIKFFAQRADKRLSSWGAGKVGAGCWPKVQWIIKVLSDWYYPKVQGPKLIIGQKKSRK